MTKQDILEAIGELSPEDREDIRRTLNQRHANDEGFRRLDEKLAGDEG